MANEILIKEKSTITYDTTTNPAITLTSLGSASGRVGTLKDLGAATYPRRYTWTMKTKFGSSPTEGRTVELYVAYGSGIQDGGVGGTDAALGSANSRYQCQLIGHLYCRNVTSTQQSSGIFEMRDRYFTPVVYNDTDQAFSGTAGDHQIIFKPLAEELQ